MDRYDKNTRVEIAPLGWLYVAEQALRRTVRDAEDVESRQLASVALRRAVQGTEGRLVTKIRKR